VNKSAEILTFVFQGYSQTAHF